MDDRAATAWLLRRAGFGGPAPAGAPSADAVLDRLVDPQRFGIPAAADPWDDDVLGQPPSRETRGHAVAAWLERMRTTPRPLEERMAWVWHDHFATSLSKVRHPALLVAQIRTIQRLALGSFPELVRAMTVDAAMLLWLDGATSTGRAPNENYGRELLELFTVGVGAHTEHDVMAAARALTGWRVDRGTGRATFVPRRHDDTPQRLLGREGVHDVDTVVDAACSAPACAPYVTRALALHLLGPDPAGDDELIADLATGFARSGLQIRPLVRALLAAGMRRDDTAVVEAPVPWLVRAQRLTGAGLPARVQVLGLVAAGQVPLRPPDVGGWPAHPTWLASSTVLARASLAATVAAATPDGPVREAARRRDPDGLAGALGRPDPFGPATAAAMRAAPDAGGALAVALAAPEQVVI